MKKCVKVMLPMALLSFCCFTCMQKVAAEENTNETQKTLWNEEDSENFWTEEESGGFGYGDEPYVPGDGEYQPDDEDPVTGYYQYEEKELYTMDRGQFDIPETIENSVGESVAVSSASFEVDDGYGQETTVLIVDEKGNYEAVNVGQVTVDVSMYDSNGTWIITVVYDITVRLDMTSVTLDKTSETKYCIKDSYSMPEFTFQMISETLELPDDPEAYQISCETPNEDMNISCYIGENHTIVLYPYEAGSASVTITINNKQFKVHIKAAEVSMPKNSLLMSKKQVKQLHIKGAQKGIKWSSSNPKAVKVFSNGKVKAKRTGNAVIKAKIGDVSLGCAVSVVLPKRQKVIKRAIKIGQTCTYSQAKRMEKNYYDCSSLVWRSYKLCGINFGNANYAPVAADQGKWCVKNKKIVKGGLSNKNIQNMKINAGDVMFETGESDNGRFRGIFHVEMISGYVCYGFDSNNNPVLGIAWANRPVDYYWHGGQLVGRP